MPLQAASSVIQRAIMKGKDMSITTAPNLGDLIGRTKARIGRLALAIAKTKDTDRRASLNAEMLRRKADLAALKESL